jgi:thiamine biosynthesis lipoprotein
MAPSSTTTAIHQTRFRAMATDVHLVIVGGDQDLVDHGVGMVQRLEGAWSRFLDTSEVTALNHADGYPVIVSPETIELVAHSVTAWRLTHGRFDPTVGAALITHGYDTDFSHVAARVNAPAPTTPAPGPTGIEIDPILHAVTVPAGVVFDPGGIAKGMAADLTAAALLTAGAHGALVNLGGDLRATGRPPSTDGWVVTVPDPLNPDRELLRLAIAEGAVATSSRLQRRWQLTTGDAHHLIDPATGRPADTDVIAATVVAEDAWWAEALTKTLFLTGPDAIPTLRNAHGVVVTANGRRHASPHLHATLR